MMGLRLVYCCCCIIEMHEHVIVWHCIVCLIGMRFILFVIVGDDLKLKFGGLFNCMPQWGVATEHCGLTYCLVVQNIWI